MSDTSEITTLVRQIIRDFSHTQAPGDTFTYSSSSVFTLTESNPITISNVLHNDSELGSGEYSFDSDTNKITISASLTSGDTIEIQYTYYPDYSDTEIENYIKATLIHLSINHYYTLEIDGSGDIYPEITEQEKNLIAFLAATLIEPNNESYALPDLRVSVPNNLPTDELIRRAIANFKHEGRGYMDLT